jgi:hypothetical protein
MGNTERKHNSDKLTERTVSVGHSKIDAMQHGDERSKNVSRKIVLVHHFRSEKLVVKARNESRVKIALCKCLQNNGSQRLKDKTFAIKPCAKRSAARTECYYSDQQSHILQESLKRPMRTRTQTFQSSLQLTQSFSAIHVPNDQFADHGIVIRSHRISISDSGVDTNSVAGGKTHVTNFARLRNEVLGRIFCIHTSLKSVTF